MAAAYRLCPGLQQALIGRPRAEQLPQVNVGNDGQSARYLVPLTVPVPLQHCVLCCRRCFLPAPALGACSRDSPL